MNISLDPAVRSRVDRHLDAIDAALAAAGRPRDERRSITDDVEVQILENLAQQYGTGPTPAQAEFLISKMDPPQAYLDGSHARQSFAPPPIAPSSPPPLSPPPPPKYASSPQEIFHSVRNSDMGFHVSLLGALFIGLNALGLISVIVLTLFSHLFQSAVGMFVPSIGFPFSIMHSWVHLVFAGTAFLVLACSLPGIIGGIGLLRRWGWARYLCVVLAAFHLPSFPFGTALGIYAFWVLLQSDTKLLFEARR